MADKESQLRLLLTAKNEASPVFEAISKAMNDFVSGTESANKVVSGMNSDMRTLADTMDGAYKSIEAVGKSFGTFEGLSKTLGDDEKSVTALSESFSTLVKTGADIGKFTEAANGISKAMADNEKAVNALSESMSSLDRTMGESGSSMRAFENSSNGAANGAKGLDESVNKAGLLIGMQQLGQSMEHIGGLGDGLFKDAITSASEFEASMSRIHAVLMNREPDANMKQMQETALKLGSNSKFSANEIAQGMYDLARQGLSSTQILGDGVNGAIDVVNNLAQSVDGNMGDTAKVITDVLHEFNLKGTDLAHVGDLISGTMHTSSISMNDFYYAMRQVGPVASNMHQGIDDVSTSIALLAQHGITGSAAGTALKNMLLGLEPRTAKAAALMKDLGISAKNGASDSFYELNGNLKPLPDIVGILHDKFGDLNDSQKQAALSATFTKYGLAGLNTIVMEGKDKFEDLKKTLGDEKAADIAREKLNNLQGDMLRLHAATQTMSKSFGDTMAPALRGAVQAVQGLVQWFTNLSPQMKEIIMIVGGVTSAMVAVGGAILGVVSTIGFLNMGLEGAGLTLGGILGPVGLVIGAVALLSVGAFEIYKHWDQVIAITQNLYKEMITLKNEAIDRVKQAFDAVMVTANSFKDSVIKLKDDAIETVRVKFNELTAKIYEHKTALEVTGTVLAVIFGPALIKTGVEAAIAATKLASQFTVSVVSAGIEATIAGAKLAATFIANIVTSGVEAVVSAGKITVSFIASIIQTGVEATVAGAKLTAGIIASTVELGAQTVITAAKITGQAIVALVSYAAQGWTTVASIAGQTAALVINTASLVAQKVALVASEVATGALTAAQWLLNIALDANPIGIVIIAIAALGAAVYAIIHYWTDITSAIQTAWNWLTKWNGTKAENKTTTVTTVHQTVESSSVSSGGSPLVQASGSVPQFAKGGVVNKPTLALIGEGGEREFVIPESALRNQGDYSVGLPSTMPFGGGRSGGGHTVVNGGIQIIVQGAGKDGKQIGSEIMTVLRQQMGFAL